MLPYSNVICNLLIFLLYSYLVCTYDIDTFVVVFSSCIVVVVVFIVVLFLLTA